jgi:NRPS condensation-like uncharacterized protein
MKNINEFLPKRPDKSQLALIQAKIPKRLHEKARAVLKSRRLTWNDLMCAACKQITEE